MIKVTEPYFWADGQTVSCYAQAPFKKAKWIAVKIVDCENAYPCLPLYQSIREFIKEIFEELNNPRM